MKTIKKISVLFVATVISSFALSCSSSDDGGGGGSASVGTIKAKVDGNWVTTMKEFQGHPITVASVMMGTLHMQGSAGTTSTKAFVMNVNGFEGVGTYDIGGGTTGLGAANASYQEIEVDPSNPMDFESTTWAAPYTGGEKVGEIKVAEYVEGDYIKGTFHFEAKNQSGDDKKNVTEGSFHIEF